MSNRGIYSGYALQQVDDKGRVAIPAALRNTLIARNGPAADPKEAAIVHLAMHESDPCLVGYDNGYAERQVEALNARARAHAGDSGAPNSLILRDSSMVDTVPFDASGRFILPPFPRTELNIKLNGYAFFIGLGDSFEIWAPEEVLASATASPKMKQAVKFFLAEREKKA